MSGYASPILRPLRREIERVCFGALAKIAVVAKSVRHKAMREYG